MAELYDARINDIAFFFVKNNDTNSVWIPHDVYASPDRLLGASSDWEDAIFTRARQKPNAAPYYVTNLANLEPPGEPPSPNTLKQDRTANAKRKPKKGLSAQPGDLVIVPYDDPAHAYLVKKAEYEDPDVCTPISPVTGADLTFMALTEGVVLANIPKQDLAGMTCYLLNLVALFGA